jgi:hypothetical protein
MASPYIVWAQPTSSVGKLADECPYRRPLQKGLRKANPLHREGIAGRLAPARPSSGSAMTSGVSSVSRRCPPIRFILVTGPAIPLQCRGFADALTLRPHRGLTACVFGIRVSPLSAGGPPKRKNSGGSGGRPPARIRSLLLICDLLYLGSTPPARCFWLFAVLCG